MHAMPVAIGHPDATGGKFAGQLAIGSASPTDFPSFLLGQYVFGRNRHVIRGVICPTPACCGFGKTSPVSAG
jgi:hypothetical protein